MPQRNFLLPLSAALVLCWFCDPALGEVGADFSRCLDFFYSQTPPKAVSGAQYQPICQRYENRYHFASLYNRQHRSPLFSAYKLSAADGKRPRTSWKYEPQLSYSGASQEMQPCHTTLDQNVIESQAVPQDYSNSSFTKGHLTPSMHQGTRVNRRATFTLTNIIPQRKGSNAGPWNQLESQVLTRFKSFCNESMYVITGVLPYRGETRWMNSRVSVPEYLWSAYCCPSFSSSLPESVRSFFPTFAAVGRNDFNSSQEIVPVNPKAKPAVRGYDVKQMPLETLEGILARRLDTPISLFHGNCQH